MVNAVVISFIIWKSMMLKKSIEELQYLICNFDMALLYICPSEKSQFNQIKKDSIKRILEKIKEINKELSKFGSFLKECGNLGDFRSIKRIDSYKIKSILEDVRYNKETISILSKKDSLEFKNKQVRRENFQMKIDSILKETLIPLNGIFLYFRDNANRFKSKKLKGTKYKEWISEIDDIFSVGYPTLAVFVAGRTLERIILDYIISLKKAKKIDKPYKKIKDMDFSDKLNYLKGKWISEKDYFKINSIKFDRNLVAHYTSKKEFLEAQKDAESDIKISINIIERIYNKFKKLNK